MVSGTTAVGSQQLADEVDSAGSPTKKEKRYIYKDQKLDLCILTFG